MTSGRRFQARSRWVPAGQADIFALEDGAQGSPALMLFSGARCNTGMWEPVLAGLAEQFHVIRHDMRGTGRSRLGEGAQLGLDRYADDAAAVLDALGVASCAAWGMAFGARVALAFASRHPGRVVQLALYDASVERPDAAAQRDGARRAKAERQRLGLAEITREERWFQHDDPDTVSAGLRAAYADTDHARYARGISVPTLIAAGEFDPNLPAARRLSAMIPGSRLAVLPATGHGSVLQRPGLCLSLLRQFLTEPPGRAPSAPGLHDARGTGPHDSRSTKRAS